MASILNITYLEAKTGQGIEVSMLTAAFERLVCFHQPAAKQAALQDVLAYSAFW